MGVTHIGRTVSTAIAHLSPIHFSERLGYNEDNTPAEIPFSERS
jgi:hypothetical protein